MRTIILNVVTYLGMAAGLLPILVPAAFANIAPEARFVIDARLDSGQQRLESRPTLSSPDDAVSIVAETGTVQIDLYVCPMYGRGTSVLQVQTELLWPQEWSLLAWRTAGDGRGEIRPAEVGAGFGATWTTPRVVDDQLVLVGRFLFQVTCAGLLDVLGGSVRMGVDDRVVDMYIFPASARIGFSYATCAEAGPDYISCVPCFSEYVHGRSLRSETQSELALRCWHYAGDDCRLSFESTADWMRIQPEIEVEPLGQTSRRNYTVRITLSAEGLSPGTYEGFIVAHGECDDCTAISLTVTDRPPQSVSWGQVKAQFRPR